MIGFHLEDWRPEFDVECDSEEVPSLPDAQTEPSFSSDIL